MTIEVFHAINGELSRYVGTPSSEPTSPNPTPAAFTLRYTEPDFSNSGVGFDTDAFGFLVPAPTEVLAAPSNGILNVVSGQTVRDKIINCYVDIEIGAFLINCEVRGPANPTVARPLVRVTGAAPTAGGPRANIRFCTVKPQTPSAYNDGIGYKGYHAFRCLVQDCTDSFAAFSTSADGICNILIQGCFSPNMVQWRPDYAYPGGRPHTHNDTIQLQGNKGGPGDILVEGSSFNARFVTYAGTQPLETPPVQVAAIMITPNTGSPEHGASATFIYNWLRGGQHCVNHGATNEPGSMVIFRYNRFERPGTDPRAPIVALNLSGAVGYESIGNTYIDNGATVSEWGV